MVDDIRKKKLVFLLIKQYNFAIRMLWYITIGKPNYNEIPANDPTKFKKEEKSGTKKAIKKIKNVNANL